MHPADLLIIALAVLTLAIFVTGFLHLMLRIPYVPTSRKVVLAMVDAAKLKAQDHVFDPGAGDGRLLIEAVKRCPDIRATGLELVPTVWLLGKFNIFLAHAHVTFLWKNAMKADLSDADVVFLYMGPRFMEQFEGKCRRELKKGARVISHTFTFPGWAPSAEIPVEKGKIFVYQS